MRHVNYAFCTNSIFRCSVSLDAVINLLQKEKKILHCNESHFRLLHSINISIEFNVSFMAFQQLEKQKKCIPFSSHRFFVILSLSRTPFHFWFSMLYALNIYVCVETVLNKMNILWGQPASWIIQSHRFDIMDRSIFTHRAISEHADQTNDRSAAIVRANGLIWCLISSFHTELIKFTLTEDMNLL